MFNDVLKDKKGFTIVELAVTMAILGVLTATSLPLINAYRTKAEYLDLELTMKNIMDGLEICYIETDEFFPETTPISWYEFGQLTVERGEAADLPDILYNFNEGHKHKYIFYYYKFDMGDYYDYSFVRVDADNDYNRNGLNDIYYIYMIMLNGQPWGANYRRIYQVQ